MKKEFTEYEWDMEYYDSLSEERKEQLGEQAEAIFNSKESPLSFMIESGINIKVIEKPSILDMMRGIKNEM